VAFARQLAELELHPNTGSKGMPHIISSSYDSYDALLSKYPEFVYYNEQMKAMSDRNDSMSDISVDLDPSPTAASFETEIVPATRLRRQLDVYHGIDATQPINRQLGLPSEHVFDCIVFNFPHLGELILSRPLIIIRCSSIVFLLMCRHRGLSTTCLFSSSYHVPSEAADVLVLDLCGGFGGGSKPSMAYVSRPFSPS
jgi:hypothetical protein